MNEFNYVKGFDLFGVKARQIPCLTGNGEPIESIALKIGLLYINEDNGDMYKCIKGEEGLVWTLVNNKDTNTNSGQNPTNDAGLTAEDKSLLLAVVNNALYGADIGAVKARLNALWGESGGRFRRW